MNFQATCFLAMVCLAPLCSRRVRNELHESTPVRTEKNHWRDELTQTTIEKHNFATQATIQESDSASQTTFQKNDFATQTTFASKPQARGMERFSNEDLQYLANFPTESVLFQAVQEAFQERRSRSGNEQVKVFLRQHKLQENTFLASGDRGMLDIRTKANFKMVNSDAYELVKAVEFAQAHVEERNRLLGKGYVLATMELVLKNPAWEAYFDIGADYLQKDFQNIHDKNMENAVSKVSPEELQILKETQQWPDDCISNWLQFCNWNVREEDKALGNRFHWTVFRLYNPLEKPNPLSLDQVKKCYTLNIKPELASMLKHLSLNHTRGYLQGEFLSKYQNVALMETIIAHQWNQLTNLHDLEQRMVPNNLQADN